MSLEECLPAELRGPDTTFSPLGNGQSGASVHRVDTARGAFVLKVAVDGDASWSTRLAILQRAADAGLAPRVVHVDEARRAVVSVLVEDRFPARLYDPATRDAAIDELGQTLRRVHELPLEPGMPAMDGRALLAERWAGVSARPLPAFARAAVERMLTEEPPPADRAPVLSHNDVNPGNLVHDGEHLMLVDWDATGANDPLYDFASIALFLRMDDATSVRLLGEPSLPPRFAYFRRLVAALCGVTFLQLTTHTPAIDEAFDLGDFYARLRSGALQLSSPEGRWQFMLALLRQIA